MKRAIAVLTIAMSGFLFVNPASARPHRHHHHVNRQCRHDCKMAYKQCKHSHGRRCGEIRRECERGCR